MKLNDLVWGDSSKSASLVEPWLTKTFLLTSRVLPWLDDFLVDERIASEVGAWPRVVHLIQACLADEIARLRAAGLLLSSEALLVKGADSLFWGRPLRWKSHTRDIDVIASRGGAGGLEVGLPRMGYQQISKVLPDLGLVVLVTEEERLRAERGHHEKFPWSRHVPFEDGEAVISDVRVLPEDAVWPLRLIGGRVFIEFSVDIHHCLWPQIAFERLCLDGDGVLSGNFRLDPVSRVLSYAIKSATELVNGYIGAFGGLCHLVQDWRSSTSAMLSIVDLQNKAAEWNVEKDWRLAVALLQVIGPRADRGLPIFGVASDRYVVALRDRLRSLKFEEPGCQYGFFDVFGDRSVHDLSRSS